PPSLALKYVNEIASKAARVKLLRALDAIAEEGLTVPKAAEQYGVDEKKLREAVHGQRKKSKKGILELQKQLSLHFKSMQQRNSAVVRKIMDMLEDGDVNRKQVADM